MNFKFDPRTKIFLIVLSIIILALRVNLFTEIVIVLILIFPFFLVGEYHWCVSLLAIYGIQLFLAIFILPHVTSTFILYSLSSIASGLRRMMPSIISGSFALKTTTVGEWIAVFKKWRFPNAVIIPFAVMGRFFPTIRQDYRQIRNAMAFRGIGQGFFSMMKKPMQSLEYIIIPLLMNASQVAQDLTISALTKGLSLPGRHTSIVKLQLTMADWLYMLVALTPVAIYVGGTML